MTSRRQERQRHLLGEASELKVDKRNKTGGQRCCLWGEESNAAPRVPISLIRAGRGGRRAGRRERSRRSTSAPTISRLPTTICEL
ncbi:hypothetical protein EVAR_92429_1 [Eumeta japonica]|uniref:Uncharacterized protein n=1 Tax=Eumeta variegata TaxID=151549 RepID=A0A4C1T6R0_EUMVA|nr:hypothetical protein EVAR_92429_1 [Eumeta japonica]